MKRVLVLFLVVNLIPALSPAQQPGGMVWKLEGHASASRPPQHSWAALNLRENILLGDRISTAERSRVAIHLFRKALLTMHQLSVVTITEEIGLTLHNGKITYAVPPPHYIPGKIHEIRTSNAIVAVRGTVEIEQRPAHVGDALKVVTNICTLVGRVFAGSIDGPPIQLGPDQCIAITGNVLGPVYSAP